MLQEFNAKNAQFRILPQYKVKSEGEVVGIFAHYIQYFRFFAFFFSVSETAVNFNCNTDRKELKKNWEAEEILSITIVSLPTDFFNLKDKYNV